MSTAGATGPADGTGWAISMLAQPANFSPSTDASCEIFAGSRLCDSYSVLATNVGGRASEGPVTITDVLPTGLTSVGIRGISGIDLTTNAQFGCKTAPLQCTDESEVAPGDTLLMTVNVLVAEGLSGSVVNTATVSGGGGVAGYCKRSRAYRLRTSAV